jgi:hypothetical protein
LHKLEKIMEKVTFFKPFPFVAGQKIHITEGPRRGDWLVLGREQGKIRLRCPVSGKEVSWDQFCYFVEERAAVFPS